MADPTRYDAVDDKLVECQRGAAVRYKDWKAADDALRAKVEALRLAGGDMLLVRVAPDYKHDQVVDMAQALQRVTEHSVVVVSVDAQLSPLSPVLSKAELNSIFANCDADGWLYGDISAPQLRAIFRRVMAMRAAP